MNILAISSSCETASAAALYNENTLELKSVSPRGGHSQILMPLIDELLFKLGADMKAFDLIAVDIGPGSFTGVRIGVCAANAIGLACKKPILGISSLNALRYSLSEPKQGAICSLIDCRNKNGYASLHMDGVCKIPESAVVIEDMLKGLPNDVTFVGNGAIMHRELVLDVLKRPIISDIDTVLSSSIIRAALDTPSSEYRTEVFPMYLRPSQAERMKNAEKR
ncbi:MAG: tRNA (adenosine(37)-N6)-threonylcarbamoyltransferase complex dimerization subunit type 1 TsaB [Clostridia bacterium]|nr:tRNA (adenosine(37)-N6)-threonylcarbamoyltransferase complex dimerization subunit type 1 TsaB [Clostridia bacterium]